MASQTTETHLKSAKRLIYSTLPRAILALGFVSLFMDVSSELAHSLLPIYMSTVLSASMATIGVIEGMAEATASITKVVSGVISDYFRKLKGLLVLGYGLGTLSKPMFPLTVNIGWVFMARFFDRMGKGIRGAPRAALVADIMPQEQRGAAYGLRQSLDSVGAFLGPLLAIALMIWFAGDIKSVLWAAVVPAIITISILVLAVKEPSASHLSSAPQKRLGFTHGVDTKLANKTHCR